MWLSRKIVCIEVCICRRTFFCLVFILPGFLITWLMGSGWHSSNLMISGECTGFCFSNIFTQMFWFQELIQKSTPILILMWKFVGAGVSIYHRLQLSTYFTIFIITIDTIAIKVRVIAQASAFPSICIHPNSPHTRASVIVVLWQYQEL